MSGAEEAVGVVLLGPAYPLRGGVSQHAAALAQGLQSLGLSVRFLSLKRQYPAFLFPGRSQFDPSRSPLRYPSEPILDPIDPISWFATFRRIRALRPDRVLFIWWNPLFAFAYAFLGLALKASGVRTLLLCHNVEPHERSRAAGLLTRLVLGAFDRFLVHADASAAELRALRPGAAVTVAPLPSFSHLRRSGPRDRGQARRELGVPSDGPLLLFFGLIRHYKGLEDLIDAMVEVRRHLPACRLLIAGESYLPLSPFRERARALGLEPAIQWQDRWFADEEVPALFAAADLLVLPYRAASQSGVLLTARAFGLPVVATRVGGLEEALRPGVDEAVAPNAPMALARGILRALHRGRRAPMEEADWRPYACALS